MILVRYCILLTAPTVLAQWDDPLDAIAVHAWNGAWGVIAVGMLADPDLITNAYGTNAFDGSQRAYGFVFPGSDGHLLCAQIAYALFISGTACSPFVNVRCVTVMATSCARRVHMPCSCQVYLQGLSPLT